MKGNSPLFSDYKSSSLLLACSNNEVNNEVKNIFYSYSPSLNGNSQPYKDQYSVYAKMLKKDIKNGVYKIGIGYSKNPTSQNLENLRNGNYIKDKHFCCKIPYVITVDGKIIIGKRNGNGRNPGDLPTPHPTLIGGINPKVKMAGILDIRGGKIYSYDDRSGHYRPNIKSMKWADEAFDKFPKCKNFKGGKR